MHKESPEKNSHIKFVVFVQAILVIILGGVVYALLMHELNLYLAFVIIIFIGITEDFLAKYKITNLYVTIAAIVAFVIFISSTIIVLLKFEINPYLAGTIIIITAIITLVFLFYLAQNEILRTKMLEKFRKFLWKNAFVALLAIFILLFLLLVGIHNIISPPLLYVEPQKYEEKISAGDSLIRTISITNRGIFEKKILIKIDSIENWVNLSRKELMINSEQTENVNFSVNIPLQMRVGEYRGDIEIIYENNTVREIPISLIVQPPAQFQATIDAPEKVNKTDYFKIKITIKNIGESPVYGINIRLKESSITDINLSKVEKEKTIDFLSKNTEFTTEWRFEANKIGWHSIQFDINSNNARNQTIITEVKVE
ncbi:MAG: hypothetical protein O8C64_03525 [Candidatus Methanoperedens sp.]|nr:hypothetical protein [Candidatus Methanoperedens sp.]MCZ7405654.1 hypothetical protein [Candidatus Methanoperedens sp.]